MKVSGALPMRPSISFAHFGFDDQLMGVIRKSEYTQPTPIQCQAIPIALSGRDIIGIAKTGSGKTAAFLWPALVHIMDQPELEPGDGPIALICAPTRELCQQIFVEARRFGRVYNIHAAAVFGGGNKYEQSKALQEGAEIVVATPGRLIDHVKAKSTNLQRVTYLVFDEADRMFDMGFEPQVRSIANNVRPDRQTLLFSATFKKKVEMLCRDILTDPIRVVVGELGEANEDVTQIVEILPSVTDKWTWLTRHLVSFTSAGSVLIFVTKKVNSEELAAKLKTKDFEVVLLHGDMDQFERNKVINSFKKQEIPILVATDVAARGLDIPSIKTVINYDVARDIHTHTHRIGRTGRAGEKGEAYTLLTSVDQNFSGDLVRNLEGANQIVPEVLMDMAMKNGWFRKSRFRHGRGKASGREGRPRMRERPGLGMHGSSDNQVGEDRGAQHSYPDSSYPQSSSVSSSSSKSSFRPTSSSSSFSPGGVFSSSARNDRTSALKAAFQAQYKSHFCAAASSTSNTWDARSNHSTAKPPDKPKASKPPKPLVKKSRWDPA
ncbi:ATP-dependent RNA helicase ddx42 [Desmophyllum pertusum]|uniref:ATP-dependent RNA helicase DDX42 n=1 Tax=Desmophyllum pertusum TaxID=174260 RepID=A0A9W9Z5U1_9CNID|nr:ATP-dependent RNA helicase ddx42 [Desmophyllum pertusum]